MRTSTLILALLTILPLAFTGAAAPSAVSATDSPTGVFRTLALPAGHVLVGQVVNGEWTIDAMPREAAVPMSSLGAEAAHDCMNDYINYYSPQWFPLTANVAYPAAPNTATAGFCTGARGLAGPVNYMTFSATGDIGGRMALWDAAGSGYFEVGCHVSYGSTAAAGGGVGVASEWRTTYEASQAICWLWTDGPQPSEFKDARGAVLNENYSYGTVHGAFVTSGVATGPLG